MTQVEALHPVKSTTPGWYADPDGRHDLRYFDGRTWTEHVTHFGPTPCPGCRERRS